MKNITFIPESKVVAASEAMVERLKDFDPKEMSAEMNRLGITITVTKEPAIDMFFQFGGMSYFVSSDGKVLSTGNPDSDPASWHEIAQYNGKGYRRVRLRGKTFKVHRLVAEAFLPNPDKLPYVIHLDGDKNNNNVSNLQWSGKQSNHSLVHG